MILIVPDTNIFYASPSLAADEWQSLGQHRDDWAVKILVPDVVFMETVRVVRQKWAEAAKPIVEARLGEFGVQKDLEVICRKIEKRIDSFEADFKAKLTA